MKIIFSTCALFLAFLSFGQYDIEDVKEDSLDTETSGLWSKIKPNIYIGGEGALSVSAGQTFIYAAPLAGYDITEQFSAGMQVMYQLFRINTGSQIYNLSSYGVGTFARFRPIEQIILQTEFDLFNTVDLNGQLDNRIVVPAFMAGLGYANNLSNRAYYQILLMYDFINNPNMPLTPFIFRPLHLKIGFIWHIGEK